MLAVDAFVCVYFPSRVSPSHHTRPRLRSPRASHSCSQKKNASQYTQHSVCGRLQKVGVIVDSITVGTEKNLRLKCLSLATGGYAFHPTTLRAALRLNEQETVLSAGQRARQRPVSDRTKRVRQRQMW